MLKKIVVLLIGIMGMAAGGNAQTMKDVFLAMPDSVLPLLSKDNRADFIDFLASKMQARVKNAYNENSYMDTLTIDYTHIRLTPASDVSLKLLPLTDSTKVICMVHTFRSDASESKISFYDKNWRLLDGRNVISFPTTADFLLDNGSDSLKTVKDKLEIPMIVASLSPSTTDLTFTYDTGYLPQEDKPGIKACLRPAIVKKWENGRYISK